MPLRRLAAFSSGLFTKQSVLVTQGRKFSPFFSFLAATAIVAHSQQQGFRTQQLRHVSSSYPAI